jgi:periplasmic copper chaperone A
LSQGLSGISNGHMPCFARLPFAAALAAASLTLSACSQSEEPNAAASESAIAEVEITNARLILPPVSGNPGAAYFELTNHTAEPLVLTRVSIAGASRTAMHETLGTSMVELPKVTIAPGQQTVFAPGGQHVMVFGELPRSSIGQTRNMTFLFEGGRRETAEAVIHAFGEDSGDHGSHPGMMH